MIAAEEVMLTKMCGLSMAAQHGPKKCIGLQCTYWTWSPPLKRDPEPSDAGGCALALPSSLRPYLP